MIRGLSNYIYALQGVFVGINVGQRTVDSMMELAGLAKVDPNKLDDNGKKELLGKLTSGKSAIFYKGMTTAQKFNRAFYRLFVKDEFKRNCYDLKLGLQNISKYVAKHQQMVVSSTRGQLDYIQKFRGDQRKLVSSLNNSIKGITSLILASGKDGKVKDQKGEELQKLGESIKSTLEGQKTRISSEVQEELTISLKKLEFDRDSAPVKTTKELCSVLEGIQKEYSKSLERLDSATGSLRSAAGGNTKDEIAMLKLWPKVLLKDKYLQYVQKLSKQFGEVVNKSLIGLTDIDSITKKMTDLQAELLKETPSLGETARTILMKEINKACFEKINTVYVGSLKEMADNLINTDLKLMPNDDLKKLHSETLPSLMINFDKSLQELKERKEVPGVAALITQLEGIRKQLLEAVKNVTTEFNSRPGLLSTVATGAASAVKRIAIFALAVAPGVLYATLRGASPIQALGGAVAAQLVGTGASKATEGVVGRLPAPLAAGARALIGLLSNIVGQSVAKTATDMAAGAPPVVEAGSAAPEVKVDVPDWAKEYGAQEAFRTADGGLRLVTDISGAQLDASGGVYGAGS